MIHLCIIIMQILCQENVMEFQEKILKKAQKMYLMHKNCAQGQATFFKKLPVPFSQHLVKHKHADKLLFILGILQNAYLIRTH